jgi:hypothetical protein
MRSWGSRFGVLVTAVLVSRGALAADPALDPPLMVAAEIDAGLGVDARAVREAIGAELHRTITAPAAGPDADLRDVLLVSMSRERTVVSFRARTDEAAARAIRTPADRAARLHAVAWLAGNLARDQVSPLVMVAALESAPPSDAATEAPAPPPAATTAPPDVRTAAPPPIAASPSHVAPAPSTVLTRRSEDAPAPLAAPTWIFSLAGGSAMTDEAGNGGARQVDFARAFQAEVQHRQGAGWLLGGAIDYGPTPFHRMGYAVTGALQQRWSAFRLEESLGFGIEASVNGLTMTPQTLNPMTGASSGLTAVSPTTAPYLRAFVTAAYPLWRSWDLVLRVGAHSDIEATLDTAYLATSLGVRLSLP